MTRKRSATADGGVKMTAEQEEIASACGLAQVLQGHTTASEVERVIFTAGI